MMIMLINNLKTKNLIVFMLWTEQMLHVLCYIPSNVVTVAGPAQIAASSLASGNQVVTLTAQQQVRMMMQINLPEHVKYSSHFLTLPLLSNRLAQQ